MRRTATIFIVGALVASCASIDASRFQVGNIGGLDRISLSLVSPSGSDAPIFRNIELCGDGRLTYVWGKSRRTHDEFWDAGRGGDWDDRHEVRAVLLPDRTTALFQAIVDAGVFSKRTMRRRKSDVPQPIATQVKIGLKRTHVLTANSDVLEIFDTLVREAAEHSGMAPAH